MPIDSTVGTHFTDLGVCLGHQSIGQVFGGNIVSPELMHGKTSQCLTQVWGFPRLENPMTATRYHSLVIDQSCPDVLKLRPGLRMELLWVCDIGTILTSRASSFTRECCRLQESSYYEISWNNYSRLRGLMEK